MRRVPDPLQARLQRRSHRTGTNGFGRPTAGWPLPRGGPRDRRRVQVGQADIAGNSVWSHGGIVCTEETYKNVVKMTFAKGAALKDPSRLFNSSLGWTGQSGDCSLWCCSLIALRSISKF